MEQLNETLGVSKSPIIGYSTKKPIRLGFDTKGFQEMFRNRGQCSHCKLANVLVNDNSLCPNCARVVF